MQKPDTLTTSGRFNCNYHKYFNNKHLIPAKDGQCTPAKGGQSHRLFQVGTEWGAEPAYRFEDMNAYKLKVEHFLKEQISHITISKLRTNKSITNAELEELERLIFEKGHLGTKEKFQKAFGQKHPISFFVRSLVGLDASAARQEFSEFLRAAPMTATQIKFIDIIIDHLSVNGIIEKALLVQPPFTDINDKGVFGLFTDDQVGKIISIIDGINGNAERVMAS